MQHFPFPQHLAFQCPALHRVLNNRAQIQLKEQLP